jgi:hypothetical protein
MVRSESDNCAEIFAPPKPLVRCDTDTIGGYAYIAPPSTSAEWFGAVSGN